MNHFFTHEIVNKMKILLNGINVKKKNSAFIDILCKLKLIYR